MRFLLLLFCLNVSFAYCQDLGSAELLINPKKTYECVEIGVTTSDHINQKIQNFIEGNNNPDSILNPFLDWEILIQATFTNTNSLKKIQRQGFYFKDFQRNSIKNTWEEIAHKYPFRIRFAADEIGYWKCDVVLKIKDISSWDTTLVFEIIENGENGFVKLTEDNKNFQRNGSVIIPIGVNLPHPYVGNNLLYSLNPAEKLNVDAWELFQNDVINYAKMGGKYYRFFMGPSASDIEFEKLGNYLSRLNYAWEIDQMIQTCEKTGMLVDFNMMLHTPLMTAGDYYQYRWDYMDFWPDQKAWPYKDPNVKYCYAQFLNSKKPSDMFSNQETLKYIKQRYRYMVARWGYSSAIMMWEPVSEPWHINQNGYTHETPYDNESGDLERKVMHQFHKEIANYIKNQLQDQNHLIGAVGRFPVEPNNVFSHPIFEVGYNDSTWFDKNIDVISISYYTSSPHKSILSKKGNDNNSCEKGENSMYCTIDKLHKMYGKPVFFAESDHGDNTYICSNMKGNKLDLMRYPISGAAGHFIWAAFGYSYKDNFYEIDERDNWQEVVLAERFFNQNENISIISNYSVQGREKRHFENSIKETKCHEYFVDYAKDNALGYVYNKTFNVHTIRELDNRLADDPCFLKDISLQKKMPISWKPNKLTIQGLIPMRKYILTFYNFENGDFENAFKIKANIFGNTKLIHPILIDTNNYSPFYWYRIQKI